MTRIQRTLPSLQEVLEHLSSFKNYERVSDYKHVPAALGTERIEELLRRMDSPHLSQPVLHIAGSKGKGSIAHLTSRLLEARGYKVGLFTSPHLEDIRERIMIDNRPVSEEKFCEAFARVRPHTEAMQDHPEFKPPTFFETLTAMGFAAFEEARVDVAVVEVGLGGRLDATNVSDLPVVASAIGPIVMDHTRILGDNLLSIAAEKAAIVRPDTSVVLCPQEKAVGRFLTAHARGLDTRLRRVGYDVRAELREPPPANAPEAPQRLDLHTWRASHYDVPLPLLGDHQRDNAAAALALAESFLEYEATGPVDTASVRRGWRTVTVPGRIEIMRREPWVVIDGAHNPASAWALSETLMKRFPRMRRVLLFAVNRDKDYPAMLRILAPLADRIVVTSNGVPSRCTDPADLTQFLRNQGYDNISMLADPKAALHHAIQLAGNGLVIAAGSLYLAGHLRSVLLNRMPDAEE